MGCLCSKEAAPEDDVTADDRKKEFKIASVQLIAPAPSLQDESIARKSAAKEDSVVRRLREDSVGGGGRRGNVSARPSFKSGGGGGGGGGVASARPSLRANPSSVSVFLEDAEKKDWIVERPKRSYHQRSATMDARASIAGIGGRSHILRPLLGAEGEQVAAGWPLWLASVAGEAIKGWVPRQADSFEKIEKVSSCYCLLVVQFFNHLHYGWISGLTFL